MEGKKTRASESSFYSWSHIGFELRFAPRRLGSLALAFPLLFFGPLLRLERGLGFRLPTLDGQPPLLLLRLLTGVGSGPRKPFGFKEFASEV